MGKINKGKALEMLQNGTTQTEVANHFGVTRQAITPLVRELESNNISVVKHTAGRKPLSDVQTYTFEDMIDINIKALEALSKVPALEKEIERLSRENEALRKLQDEKRKFENAVQQGHIMSNFTEHIYYTNENLRLSIDITKIPIFITQDSCYAGKSVLLCTHNYERKESLLSMASVEEKLGDDAGKVVQFARNFGITAAKELYGKGIGYERFREFIIDKLHMEPTGFEKPQYNLYGTTGKDPLQFFFQRLSDIIIDEIQIRDNRIKYLTTENETLRAKVESQSRLNSHRDIAPEIIDYADELADRVKDLTNLA